MENSSQLSVGGMCYQGVPSMSQIQPRPRRPPQSCAGRVGDPPHNLEAGEDMPEKKNRGRTRCGETMAQNTDGAGVFRVSFVDLNFKASRGHHDAEWADPSTPAQHTDQGRGVQRFLCRFQLQGFARAPRR